MGTDSKYLEEAMAELERSFETFSDNVEITSLIVNNLEKRLDNVCVDKTYADIQGGELEVFSLFNRELTGDAFNGYYVKKYDGEKFVNLKVRLDLLFEKISRLEKNFEKDEYLYGSIIGYSYVRYYKHHTISYRLDLGMINEYSEENYVSSEIFREVNEMNIQGGETNVIALFNKRFERDTIYDGVYWTKLPNNECWRINIEELIGLHRIFEEKLIIEETSEGELLIEVYDDYRE